jgi:hypothetical protein
MLIVFMEMSGTIVKNAFDNIEDELLEATRNIPEAEHDDEAKF